MECLLLVLIEPKLRMNYSDWKCERMRVEARETVDQILLIFYITVEHYQSLLSKQRNRNAHHNNNIDDPVYQSGIIFGASRAA